VNYLILLLVAVSVPTAFSFVIQRGSSAERQANFANAMAQRARLHQRVLGYSGRPKFIISYGIVIFVFGSLVVR